MLKKELCAFTFPGKPSSSKCTKSEVDNSDRAFIRRILYDLKANSRNRLQYR
jgi:hypothetical protein